MKKNNGGKIFKESFKMLGTDICLTLIMDKIADSDKAQQDFEDLKKIYQEKEAIFSRFDQNSELSILNRNLGQWQKASENILDVARRSLFFYKQTLGYFDPRIIEILETSGYCKNFKELDFSQQNQQRISVSDYLFENLEEDLQIKGQKIFLKKRVDFSGIAKGYITDLGAAFLRKKGWKNFLLDSGGDMYASGLDELKEGWRINIEGFSGGIFYFDICDQAVATSGITRRKWKQGEKIYHHLVNPKKPCEFAVDLKSVTVVAKTTERADVLAKVLFLMGKEEGLKFSADKKIESFFLDYRGNLSLSTEAQKN